MTDINTQATIKTPLTRAEKYAKRISLLTDRITKDQAELAAVQLEATTGSKLNNVIAGTVIVARLGRAGSDAVEAKAAVYAEDGVSVAIPALLAKAATAGTLRFVQATVVGVKEDESGSLRYKIEHGEGFDKDVDVIQGSQVHEIVSGESAPADSAVPAELNPAAEALYAAGTTTY